jgi:hypothetical protein
VACRRSCLALHTVSGGCDALLVRVIPFHVVVIIVGSHNCNPLRAWLSPLLAALGILLAAQEQTRLEVESPTQR